MGQMGLDHLHQHCLLLVNQLLHLMEVRNVRHVGHGLVEGRRQVRQLQVGQAVVDGCQSGQLNVPEGVRGMCHVGDMGRDDPGGIGEGGMEVEGRQVVEVHDGGQLYHGVHGQHDEEHETNQVPAAVGKSI